MALYKLDYQGKPIKAGERRRAAQDELGRYHWDYYSRDTSKTAKPIHKRFWATEDDAPAIVAALCANRPIETANGLKWNDALRYWQDGHPQVSGSHVYRLQLNIKYLCEFAGNTDLTVQNTSKGLFQRFLNDRAQASSAANANKAREIVAVAKYCHERLDILPERPEFLSIPKFKVNPVKREAMPLERIGDYLQAAEDFYSLGLRLIVEFMFFSGVRSTEASELPDTPERIRTDRLTILQKAKGAGKREADVPIDEYLQRIIDRARQYKKDFIAAAKGKAKAAAAQAEKLANDKLRQRRAEIKAEKLLRIADAARRCPTLFMKDSGTPWDKNSLRIRWQGCCDKAGLEYFVPHELRHTHATIAGDSNFSERYIQAAMRWDDPAMARRYVHETRNMAVEVAKVVRGKLGAALGQAAPMARDPSVIIKKVPGLPKMLEVKCDCGKIIRLEPGEEAAE